MDDAIGTLGLMPEEFYRLTWGNYLRISVMNDYKSQLRWMHTRALVSALSGTKATDIIELPFFDEKQKPVKITEEMINRFPKTLNGK